MKTKKRTSAKRPTKRRARGATPAPQPAAEWQRTETPWMSAENEAQNGQDDEAQLDWAEEIFLRDWFQGEPVRRG